MFCTPYLLLTIVRKLNDLAWFVYIFARISHSRNCEFAFHHKRNFTAIQFQCDHRNLIEVSPPEVMNLLKLFVNIILRIHSSFFSRPLLYKKQAQHLGNIRYVKDNILNSKEAVYFSVEFTNLRYYSSMYNIPFILFDNEKRCIFFFFLCFMYFCVLSM